jgi:hypothetical protein
VASTEPPQQADPAGPRVAEGARAPALSGRVTLAELVGGMRDEFLQWDRGLVGTFLALMWRPASVVRAYVIDRDARYSKPWRYLLFSIFVSIAAVWLARNGFGPGPPHVSLQQDQVSLLMDNAAWLTGAVLPLAAIAMRIAFIGLNLRFVDCLVALCYTQGQVNLVSILSIAANSVSGSSALDAPLSIVIVVYLVWAWAEVAHGPLWRRLAAAVISLVAAQLINAAIVLAVLRFAS